MESYISDRKCTVDLQSGTQMRKLNRLSKYGNLKSTINTGYLVYNEKTKQTVLIGNIR